MHYEGKIYRPWIEAGSLLIQATLGCTNNRCTFCDMYSDKKRFRIRDIDSVFEDIDEARRLYSHIESIFLIDGNAMALKTDQLERILNKIKSVFPECRRIALYSSFNDLRRKSTEDLAELRRAGLTMAYVGLESGDPVTLKRIDKGMTPQQAEEGMAKAKAAGIEILVSTIFGLGGRDRSQEHITETTRLLNILQPEHIAPMTLTIQPGTVLAEQVQAGEFVQATPLQILEEEQYLLENLADFDTMFWGDHANNVVTLRGKMPAAREQFQMEIDRAVAFHPVTRQDVLVTSPW